MENFHVFSQLLDAHSEVQAQRQQPRTQEIENLKQEAQRIETITQNIMVENAELECDFQIESDRMEFDREHNADISAMNAHTLKRLVETEDDVKEVERYPDEMLEQYTEVRAMRAEAHTLAQAEMELIDKEIEDSKVKHEDLNLKMADSEAQLKQQILIAQAEITSQSTKLSGDQAIVDQNKKKNEQLSMELTTAKRLYDAEKSTWENHCRLIENDKNKLETQLALETSTLKVLNVKIVDLSSDNANLNETIASLRKETANRVKNRDNLVAEKQRYDKKATELDEKLRELEKTSADLTNGNELNLRVIGEIQKKIKDLEQEIAVKKNEDIASFLNASPVNVTVSKQKVQTPSELGDVTFTDSNSPRGGSSSATESRGSVMMRENAAPLRNLTNKQFEKKDSSKIKRKTAGADDSDGSDMDIEYLSPKKTRSSIVTETDFMEELQDDNARKAKFQTSDDTFDALYTMPPPPSPTPKTQAAIKKTSKTKRTAH